MPLPQPSRGWIRFQGLGPDRCQSPAQSPNPVELRDQASGSGAWRKEWAKANWLATTGLAQDREQPGKGNRVRQIMHIIFTDEYADSV